MDRRDYLKPSRFGNADKRRLLETNILKEKRSIRRTNHFNLRRDIGDIAQEVINENVPPKKDKTLDRKIALKKFKAQKEAQKKALKDKKKPPFVVGIPHHGFSPLLRNNDTELHKHSHVNNKKVSKDTNVIEVRVTRASSRIVQGNVAKDKSKVTQNGQPRSVNVFKAPPSVKTFPLKDVKTTFSFQPHKIVGSVKKLTSPHTPTVLKRSVRKKPLINVGNVIRKAEENPSHTNVETDEELAAPLDPDAPTSRTASVNSTVTKEAEVNASPLLSGSSGVINTEDNTVSPQTEEKDPVKQDHETNTHNEDNERAKQVDFQYGRLHTETDRLLALAERWQEVVLRESPPQEIVDEVDSVVGQTRLLTGDKFQQFRRLVEQYEQRTGTHPVTLDDLNGFWDMVYLQVEALDKKYSSLETLKNNNWVNPEPAAKKKRRPVKTVKGKVTATEKSSANAKQNCAPLHPPNDQQVNTPTTNLKPVMGSILLSRKRTRSNSPSPYIVMRLSGIGRTSNSLAPPAMAEGTPVKVEVGTPETPKSTMKSWSKLSERKKTIPSIALPSIQDTEGSNEEEVPTFATRKSLRLMAKMQTPSTSTCPTCEIASCERRKSSVRRSSRKSLRSKTPRQVESPTEEYLQPATPKTESSSARRSSQRSLKSKTPRQVVSPVVENLHLAAPNTDNTKESASRDKRKSKKILRFSPSENQQTSEGLSELTQPEEADKPSKAGVRFSLRPSVLVVNEDNIVGKISKKVSNRRQASALSSSEAPAEHKAEENGVQVRRTTRQSRKVAFESGVAEKHGLRLPATPYKKYEAD